MRGPLIAVTALCCALLLSACSSIALPAAATPTATPRPTPRPSPTPNPILRSWMYNTTILTIYGREFGVAPILGMLGSDGSMDDMARQALPYMAGIRANNGGKPVRLAIHLIYAIATPCDENRSCLGYLDDTGVDIVKKYILPAAKRGWMVILDDQLGLSTPQAETQRILNKGYLRYDNVAIALDPEFRTRSAANTPGIPVGSVTAAEINASEKAIGAYALAHPTPHNKLLIVHQFRVPMIANRATMLTNVPHVDPVIMADGFGDPGTKVYVYDALFGKGTPPLPWHGIKLFFPNPYEQAGHGDNPMMTWPQVFGRTSAYFDYTGKNYWVRPPPNIVSVA